MIKTKPFTIEKNLVREAYKRVKANGGGVGVDQESLQMFDHNRSRNLYKIWNRLSSGSYFPPAVKAVAIPKKQGGTRILGIPTVSDRIAQMVCKIVLEPLIEPYFHQDSYGYRPGKSALDAIGVTRTRCWSYDWLVEYDIKGLFDNIDHTLLMKAVRKHTDNKWVILYIERWLKAPIEGTDGIQRPREKGVPQGGVISPLLSNLFLHYVVDVWMGRQFPYLPWCRYADDGVIHCRSKSGAEQVLACLKKRFEACHLELNSEKSKIVYCKDGRRRKDHTHTSFTFLGYSFQARTVSTCNTQAGKANYYLGFTPAVSREAKKSMHQVMRYEKIHLKSFHSLGEIARKYNPILQGWINYYGKYTVSRLYPVLEHFNRILVKWARRKYKNLKRHKMRTIKFLKGIAHKNQKLFVHWSLGCIGKSFV